MRASKMRSSHLRILIVIFIFAELGTGEEVTDEDDASYYTSSMGPKIEANVLKSVDHEVHQNSITWNRSANENLWSSEVVSKDDQSSTAHGPSTKNPEDFANPHAGSDVLLSETKYHWTETTANKDSSVNTNEAETNGDRSLRSDFGITSGFMSVESKNGEILVGKNDDNDATTKIIETLDHGAGSDTSDDTQRNDDTKIRDIKPSDGEISNLIEEDVPEDPVGNTGGPQKNSSDGNLVSNKPPFEFCSDDKPLAVDTDDYASNNILKEGEDDTPLDVVDGDVQIASGDTIGESSAGQNDTSETSDTVLPIDDRMFLEVQFSCENVEDDFSEYSICDTGGSQEGSTAGGFILNRHASRLYPDGEFFAADIHSHSSNVSDIPKKEEKDAPSGVAGVTILITAGDTLEVNAGGKKSVQETCGCDKTYGPETDSSGLFEINVDDSVNVAQHGSAPTADEPCGEKDDRLLLPVALVPDEIEIIAGGSQEDELRGSVPINHNRDFRAVLNMDDKNIPGLGRFSNVIDTSVNLGIGSGRRFRGGFNTVLNEDIAFATSRDPGRPQKGTARGVFPSYRSSLCIAGPREISYVERGRGDPWRRYLRHFGWRRNWPPLK